MDILKVIGDALKSQKPELSVSLLDTNILAGHFYDARIQATLWGSPEVLTALNDFFSSTHAKPYDAFGAMDRMQRAMRDDLNLPNTGLEDGFFIRLLLKDPSEYEKLKKPN